LPTGQGLKKDQHFSPGFRKAFAFVQKVADESGEEEARVAFRDQMLKLGHEERVRNLYRVSSKLTNRAEFFVPNSPQEKFLQSRTGRDIVLKCRQIGFTTLSGIRGLDYALWEPNAKCGIMAHAQLTVTTIFNDIVKFSYNHFLRDWGHFYRPLEKSSSRTELAFAEDGLGRPLESSMRVLFDFRGKTLNFLHVSEASRVEDDRLLGSLQGVPANGQVVYESTPQGRAGDFFRQWQNWRKMTTLAPYRGHFVPWYQFYPEIESDWQLPEGTFLTPYEKGLIESAGLTEGHIAWRRWCIEANCQGDPEKFENEYPSNDTDCFFTGDALVFASSILKAQSKNVRPPTKVGFLLSEGTGRSVFHDDAKGVVAIWDEPDPTGSYVIGADPSGGVGKDRGAAFVINQINGRTVARLWGQFDPADFAVELIKLGTYFNKAWICAEANNHGHLVTHILATKGYRNLYKRKVIDELTQKPGTKVGFLTTNESKMMVTERLKTSLKSGSLTVLDSDLIDELSAFTQVASKTGRSIRREASPGAHDDLVMAAAFAVEMAASRPVTSANEPLTAPTPEDWSGADFETGF
jgi:hypothetical protein